MKADPFRRERMIIRSKFNTALRLSLDHQITPIGTVSTLIPENCEGQAEGMNAGNLG